MERDERTPAGIILDYIPWDITRSQEISSEYLRGVARHPVRFFSRVLRGVLVKSGNPVDPEIPLEPQLR